MPLAIQDVDNSGIAQLYQRKLVLVRPDGHIAWRGDACPKDAMKLLDRVCGVVVNG